MKIINVFNFSLLLLAFNGLTFISCQDHDLYNPDQGEKQEGATPNSFLFVTDKVLDVNLNYEVPQGYKVQFEVYTRNPLSQNELKDYVKDKNAQPFLTGVTNEAGKFRMSVKVASSVTDLYVYSPNLGIPTLLHADVEGENISAFSVAEVPTKALTRNTTGVHYSKWNTFTINNLITDKLDKVDPINISEDYGALIDTNLPQEGGSLDLDLINTTYGRSYIKLKEAGEVKLYFAGHGKSDRINALAYYTYEGTTPNRETANKNIPFIVAFSELTNTTPDLGTGIQLLYRNENGELQKIFPANSIISFALLIDAGGTNVKKENIHIAYSEFGENYNAYNMKRSNGETVQYGRRPHMIGFKVPDSNDGKTIKAVIGFEDQPWDASPLTYNPGDFRDDVFVLEVNPPTALPDEIPDGTRPGETLPDGGFVFTSGILSFEDSWPKKGDYDVNDVVVSYQRKAYYKHYEDGSMFGINYLTGIDEEYVFLNNGANYTNAFGYEIGVNIKKSDIIGNKVHIESDYTCVGQGLDNELDKPTVMLFDNSKKCKVGTTFKVHTGLKEGSNISMLELYNKAYSYNPFIVVMEYNNGDMFLSKDRKEVHLTDFAPTLKMNMDLFGQTGNDDLSVPEENKYYIRSGNYPFGLDIVSDCASDLPEYTIPVETKPIDYTYPQFKTWVETNGADAKDWYTKPERTE